MPKILQPWQTNPIGYLVRARYPNARFEDTLADTFVPDLRRLDPKLLEEQAAADAYMAELQDLDAATLERMIVDQRERDLEEWRQKMEREEQKRPFNQPSAGADFGYWAKMSYWTIDEAVALSFGKDPKVASWKYLKAVMDRGQVERPV